MQITQNDQTDKTDETDQTEADQTDKTNVLARYNARGVVRELSNMRNCQFPVSMSESVTTISAIDAGASEKENYAVQINNVFFIFSFFA